MNPPGRQKGRYASKFLAWLAWGLIGLCGCGTDLPPAAQQPLAPVEAGKTKPANFILCIDNSRSIRGEAQVIIRETAMLLADLAEQGDRVTLITFGQGGRIAAAADIRDDRDRTRFAQEVLRVVRFDEDYSDIRAGLGAAVQGDAAPVRLEDYRNHCIVLSDGKLEPADRKTAQAFSEMSGFLQRELATVDRYAVVLDDTFCNDTILSDVDGRPLTGKRLMQDYVASSSSVPHFFHARQLDQLLHITVEILNHAKGSSAIGQEAGKAEFRIDDSVTSMTLVVKKRSLDGTELCQSSDIILNQPPGGRGATDQSIYRNSNYRYFDLIVVRQPHEGMWSVKLKNDETPEVLGKIVTPLKLQYAVRDHYYANESALCRAWLFDETAARIVTDQPIQIRAKLIQVDDGKPSDVFVDLHKDDSSGMFFLQMPAEIPDAIRGGSENKEFQLEFVAQRSRPGTTDLDPWFIRNSPLLAVTVRDSFIDWQSTAEHAIKLPFISSDLKFGARMALDHPHRPAFETPPRLRFTLERYDADQQRYEVVTDIKLDSSARDGGDHFEEHLSLGTLKTGIYRYHYAFVDSILKNGGPFEMQSPFFKVQIQSYAFDSWQFWAACGILALLSLVLLSSMTAKMQGTLNTAGSSQILNSKTFVSEATHHNRFELKAKKLVFVKSFILMKVISGYVKVDGQLIPQGQKVKLQPAQVHSIEHDEGSRKIARKLMVNV